MNTGTGMIETALSVGLPVPRFAIGQKVFYPNLISTAAQHPCPDCLDTKVWKVITPAGTELEAGCGRCANRWLSGINDPSSLDYRRWETSVRELTIGSIEAKSCDYDGVPSVRYMCRETGIGSGTSYNEDSLFETREAAESDGKIKAALANDKESSAPQAIASRRLSGLTIRDAVLKSADEQVWSAWYAYRRLNEEITQWAAENLSTSEKESLNEILHWERDYRESPEPEIRKALKAAEDALLSDPPSGPQKSVLADDVIYHLSGQKVGHALDLIRPALRLADGESPPMEIPNER